MPNILFLSNNLQLQNDLTNQIEQHMQEYKVHTEDNKNTVFDIAILDGKEFLQEFREEHSKVPALIFVSSDDYEYSENKLNIYIVKPIILSLFFNQLKSGINIFNNSTEGYLCFGNFELRQADKEIFNTKNNTSAKLTEREISIIQYLYKSRGKTISKNELLQNVWGYNIEVSTHTIETHIYRLRKKIEERMQDTQFIEADNGGYKLIF